MNTTYRCYDCQRCYKYGTIYFAYDRCFCSSLCRNNFMSNKKFDKNNISWKKVPTKIESSGIVYPFPSIKSTKSILKGLDNIDISSSKSKFLDCDYEYKSIEINESENFNNEDYHYYLSIGKFITSCFYRKNGISSLVTIVFKGIF